MNDSSQFIKIKKYFVENDNKIDILYTASIFRMKTPYKSGHKYYVGLINIVRGIYNLRKRTNKNVYLRLYIDKNMMYPFKHDHSIKSELEKKWIPLFKKMHKIKWIQLVTYYAPLFLEDNKIYHISTFGTIVRLLPIFENTLNKIDSIINVDIDSTEETIRMSNYMNDDAINNNVDFSYITFQNDTMRDRVVHYDIFKHYPIKYTIIMALCVFRTRFPISILNNFLKNFINFKEADSEFKIYIFETLKKMRKVDNLDINKLTLQDIIFYGCDEFFMNDYVFKYMLDQHYNITYTLIPNPLRLLSLLKHDYLTHQQQHIDFMMRHFSFKRYNQMLEIVYYVDRKNNPNQSFISLFKKIVLRLIKLIKTDLFLQDINELPNDEKQLLHKIINQYIEDNVTYIQFNQKLIL